MAVACNLAGGLGNHFYQIAHVVAYAKKHNVPYYIPHAICAYNKPSFIIQNPGTPFTCSNVYRELSDGKNPYYIDKPLMDNTLFEGYWQTFQYFDWCRQDILNVFNLPWTLNKGVVSLHVRRGDAVGQEETFPMAPIEYYSKCISLMNEKGYDKFLIFSDDISWCKQQFTYTRFKDSFFQFAEGNTDLQDMIALSNCEHHIVARSTFSFTGAWLCQNPDKIVLCPPFPLFKDCHRDMIPDYYTVVDCEISTTLDWADEYKNRQQIATPLMEEKKKLPNVTLLTLCTKDVEQGAEALKYSMKGIEFGKVKLVSDYKPANLPDTIDWVQVNRMGTIDDWNHEVFYNLWKYFDTEFVLFIHPDGFVVNPHLWKDSFLNWDYIGAPWPIVPPFYTNPVTGEKCRQGNSVSIRSRRLCKLPTELQIPWTLFDTTDTYPGNTNEDTKMCIQWKHLFTDQGIKYAPIEEAVYFSRECLLPENEGIEPFCFHKWNVESHPNYNFPRLNITNI